MAPLSINSNPASLVVQRRLGENTSRVQKNFERLSSGLRINTASDDAAGLSVASSLNTDAKVYGVGLRNVNDGISLLNIAEGATSNLSFILIRLRELSTQASNGTVTTAQRKSMNDEAAALTNEYSRITSSTKFNGLSLIDGSLSNLTIQGGYAKNGEINLSVGQKLIRGAGDGVEQSSSNVTTGGTSNDAYIGDFNGDGYNDVFSSSGGQLFIALGNGDGTLRAPTVQAAMPGSRGSTIGDVNGDGKMDAITANWYAGGVNVFLGTGNGTFQAGQGYSTASGGGGGYGITMGDFNGDGKLDIVRANYSGGVSVLIGNGNGSFNASQEITVANNAFAVQVGDVNNDGFNDIVTASRNDSTFCYLLGNGDGSFKAQVSVDTGRPQTTFVLLKDFNNDGILDVASAHNTSSSLYIQLGTGNGSFAAPTTYVSITAEVIAKDVNDDGIVDLVNAAGELFVGVGDGTFKVATSYSGVIGNNVGGLALGDLNGDGVDDIVGATTTGAHVSIAAAHQTTALAHFDLLTQYHAKQSMSIIDTALQRVQAELGSIGSSQSRLQVALGNLTQSRENFIGAASQITDVDVAEETGGLVRNQILQQAAAAILSQANQAPSIALKLLSAT